MNSEDKIVKTIALLKDCQKIGYEIVTIGNSDPENPICRSFPNWSPSVFAWKHNLRETGKNICRIDGWPAIWNIVRNHLGEMACGNGHQAQLSLKTQEMLLNGTYNISGGVDVEKVVR